MRLDEIKAGAKNWKVIKWPGTDKDVALRILSTSQLQASQFQAERHFKAEKIGFDTATAHPYEQEKDTQMLFLALRTSEYPAKDDALTSSLAKFRETLTREEREALVEEYLAFEEECSPRFEALSQEKYDELFADLKKNPDQISSVSSISTLRRLFISSASALKT